MVLALSVSVLGGCGDGTKTDTQARHSGNSPQSRADDLASCLRQNWVQAGENGYSSGSVVVDGRPIPIKEVDVTLLPKRGPGPPDKVALFDSDESGRIWADQVTQTARKKGQSKVVVRLACDSAVLVSTGFSPYRSAVEKCVE